MWTEFKKIMFSYVLFYLLIFPFVSEGSFIDSAFFFPFLTSFLSREGGFKHLLNQFVNTGYFSASVYYAHIFLCCFFILF